MKTILKLALALSLTGLSFSTQAQGRGNAVRPSWGPTVPAGKQYYYIPEVGGYYDLNAQRYVVKRDNQWVRVVNLDGYTPSSFHPVVIDYVGAQPWGQISQHRTLYPVSLPPGQVKRLQSGKGLPPGQAKKLSAAPGGVYVVEGKNKGNNGHGKGHGKH
ncbi:hypothetical protein [Hymenobacter volaticus]|uniref:RcnB family protein n=1 Tax=Hymenobacter volaticus TaxID=2932254 RepID=A0ABY4G542_9BACT|nr:hypothetical protein [Hymenobacter volaticus]UOQ66015.1 hypothetical protein MUN86_21285 [Hymenobacter volaticus]